MSKAKSASLTTLVAAKGEGKAADATKPIEAPAAPTQQSAPDVDQPKAAEVVRPVQVAPATVVQPDAMPMATKSLTVKVGVVTYNKLIAHGGANGRKTNQAIFTEALGLYFEKYGIQ